MLNHFQLLQVINKNIYKENSANNVNSSLCKETTNQHTHTVITFVGSFCPAIVRVVRVQDNPPM